MANRIATSIDLDGPFFRADPRKRFRQNVADFMAHVAAVGEADVKAQLQQGESRRAAISHGVQPARVSGHVRGRVRSMSGKRWAVSAVVSVNAAGLPRSQAVAVMAAASGLEGRHRVFRRTTSRLRKVARDRDLLKGIG